jgi:archaellum component FlaG (FlaF/FlaG flagellin family)
MGSISWGTLTPGGTSTQTIYIKNIGSDISHTLSMRATNWIPEGANSSITLTWNREGARLQPGESVAATLTLSVSSNIGGITDFGVQINIVGTN